MRTSGGQDYCPFEGHGKEVNQGELQEAAFEQGLERETGFELAMVGDHSGKGSLQGPGTQSLTHKLSTGIRTRTQVLSVKHFFQKSLTRVFEIH